MEKGEIKKTVARVKQLKLFNSYKPIKLEIWRTFTDTTLKELMKVESL